MHQIPDSRFQSVSYAHAPPAPQRDAATRPVYEPPHNQIETLLADTWGELLGIQPVGRHDNFFALGGHSLLAIRQANRLQAVLGVELPLSMFFAQPTLAKLGQTILEMLALHRCQALRPVTPASRDVGVLTASFAQQRLWFFAQLDGTKAPYHVSIALRLIGSLDTQALRRSLDQIFWRHQSLRSVFTVVDGQLRAELLPPETRIPWLECDLKVLSDPEVELWRLRREDAHAPFDLYGGPLIRVRLVRVAVGEHILMVAQHPIVSDGWSVEVFFRELSVLYEAFSHDHPNPLPPLMIQYPDYAVAQRHWLASARLAARSNYWRQNLADAPVSLTLPTDRPRATQRSFVAATISVNIDVELTRDIKRLSNQHGTTLFMTLLTAWATVLARLSGQDNLVIGVPAANRGRRELEDLIGPFGNNLPVRIDVSGQPTVTDLLSRVRTAILRALDHQDLTFEQFNEDASILRQLDHAPPFQVIFALQHNDEGIVQLSGLIVESIEPVPTVTFDLELRFRELDGGMQGVIKYSTDLFDASTIERQRGYFLNLLKGMVSDPDQPIMGIEILDAAERELLLNTWNQTESPYPEQRCIHELFEEKVRRNPEATAVVVDNQSHTYAQLNSQANRLAHHLIDLGVKPNSRVAICVGRNFGMIVGLLAILKAGGAYVPLDLSYPIQRLAYMLEDAHAVLLVADAAGRQTLGRSLPLPSVVDLEAGIQGEHQPDFNPKPNALGLTSSDLAYVVYTSGSTGIPKGIMVPHRAVCSRLTALCLQYGFSPDDRVLQFAPISFDGSVEEIFCSLVSGSAIVLRTEGWLTGLDVFWGLCEEYRVTIVELPTRFWEEISESMVPIPACIRLVIISGEAVSRHAVEAWFRRDGHLPQVVNAYGPTEATIIATIQELDPTSSYWNSIGRPIANTRIYLLDGFGKPVPLGAVGEIYIGGAGVTLGYLNKPSLTAERFVDDPFGPISGQRMYRTGDQARYLPNGNLKFLGRNDQQIKIRGFRIEPGEIEMRLIKHPLVRQAAVISHESASGDKRLVAYITLNQAAHQELASELRGFLTDVLPEYMVPAAIVPLDSLPLNPNGKLDRKRLPAPEHEVYAQQLYQPPQGPIETQLAKIWAELLGLERVGRHDNFFELGGHSLLAVKLISQIRLCMATDVSLQQLVRHSTVSSFSLCVLAGQKGDDSSRPRDLSNSQRKSDSGHDDRLFSVRLPFELDVPFRTFLYHSYPLGMLWNKTSFKEWFFHFNINLAFCVPKYGSGEIPGEHHLIFPMPRTNLIHWREMGFLDFQVYDFEFIQACQDNDLLAFLLTKVREGNYVLIYSDEYYLSPRLQAMHRHFRHEALIVGFSEATGSFLIPAYDESGEYRFTTQPYEAIVRALKSAYTETTRFLLTISPTEKILRAQTVPDLIAEQMDDYLNSRPSSTQYPWVSVEEEWKVYPANSELVFGIACYSELAKYLALYANRPKEIDPRCTRQFWEHKKLMLLRINYLMNALKHSAMNRVKLAYQDVERTARLIHNLACVGYISDDGESVIDLVQIQNLIVLAKRKEIEILNNIRDTLFAERHRRRTTIEFTAAENAIIKGDIKGCKLHPLELVLSKRKLKKAIGNEAKQWAGFLAKGTDEFHAVRALANLPSDSYPPLMDLCVDRVLRHLNVPDLEGTDAMILYSRHLIDECLNRRFSGETLYARLTYLHRQYGSSYEVRELENLSTVGNLSDPIERSRLVEKLKILGQACRRVMDSN